MAAKSEEAQAPKSRFAQLSEEALAEYVPAEAYVFDMDPAHPIYITKPDTTERALALATIVDDRGNVAIEQIKPMLESLLGDAFDRIWISVRDLPIEVTIALVMDIQDHFYGEGTRSASSLPGGSEGSSS